MPKKTYSNRRYEIMFPGRFKSPYTDPAQFRLSEDEYTMLRFDKAIFDLIHQGVSSETKQEALKTLETIAGEKLVDSQRALDIETRRRDL
jgi:hypothetical protein